jgi:hypothetical protein
MRQILNEYTVLAILYYKLAAKWMVQKILFSAIVLWRSLIATVATCRLLIAGC